MHFPSKRRSGNQRSGFKRAISKRNLRRRVTAGRKPIPACRSRTEAGRLNRGRNGRKFGRYFNHTAVLAIYLASMSACTFCCTMNWALASSAKRPPFATSSSKVPVSITRPASKTRMRVALRMVESRCAITNVVRPRITSSRAALTLASVTASSALVASSRIRIGGSFKSARAIDSRWRSAAFAGMGFEFLVAAFDEFERLGA